MSRTLRRCRPSLLPTLRMSTRSTGWQPKDAIAQIVLALSEEQADVVLLRVLGGLDAATVGDILGRTENWVWVTQHPALRKLAGTLNPKLDVRP